MNLCSDRILWKLNKNQEFSVKSYYAHIMMAWQFTRGFFLTSQIWENKVFPNITFFALEVCR